MGWTVNISKKVSKMIPKLPKSVRQSLLLLLREIEISGPSRSNWKNYGKLGKNMYHCHIKKGQPTYVVVWEIRDKQIKIVEVTYVGTHEKSPY
ncbi:MAG: cytotoxic translational repressor of toxin-antitoxin stability system [Proteobacteria bacterium]|nr:cytotoxic translational repressor of toxin-antitoxin stability system [Pseudomonadota bacterium]MBU1388728.1 cytotoxic translational repressor of toxin-antitoxin stability system [Pseudomonadota bacterium]MBU1543069.1 cytotoxic translational repressor of toxin-antitoxin stability system [Pseudomonadota bacterium]MBU2481827.1 cytotoxic translational repressor of toxin-antitoxin stability system [Pseudomonadota bacterium]